jgi:hypothetical protein
MMLNTISTLYSIKGDPLSALVPILDERLGQDPTPYFEKTIEDKNAHSLVQFYGIFHRRRDSLSSYIIRKR